MCVCVCMYQLAFREDWWRNFNRGASIDTLLVC